MIKNVVAREVHAGQKLYLGTPARGSERIISVCSIELGYRVRIETLYKTIVYGSEDSVPIEE